ncbi:F-box/LRR-repeat protein At3g58900-like [Prunus dulcis]|uniref:F-box/LRR-repeat protein At3g58900-like n=1 Tax=Prunus dulcis TaxID=3755 RepID=UPI0014823920|nr:F-box/LRR-repeat protein At3g58900-like [Prunus dulcis]
MEPKSKLMATASRPGQARMHAKSRRVDIFSHLPDEVALRILCRLSIKDLTCFGCVSKRCRQLYLLSPLLHFDEFPKANTLTCGKRLKLLNCLDRYLVHRGDNKIMKFSVCWARHRLPADEATQCFCDEYYRIMTWIHNAVRCKVQVLDLEISMFEDMAFPSCVFPCESLVHLSLDMKCRIEVPSTFFSNLQYLDLSKVNIVDEGFFKWISCSCKVIKELNLHQVYGPKNVTIESWSLESFSLECHKLIDICHLNISGEKLEEIFIDWEFATPNDKSLSIFAPNLEKFYWFGNFVCNPSLGNPGCLKEVGIFLDPEADDYKYVFDDVYTSSEVNFLNLNEETIKALFRDGSMPAPFENIRHLRVHIRSFINDLVPAMVFLFSGLHNLYTLYIKSSPPLVEPESNNASGFVMGHWSMQNLAFIKQLKEVTIELSHGSNGVEFAMYMLAHAQNLEKMVIIHLPKQYVRRKIKKSKNISKAKIVFKERNRDLV